MTTIKFRLLVLLMLCVVGGDVWGRDIEKAAASRTFSFCIFSDEIVSNDISLNIDNGTLSGSKLSYSVEDIDGITEHKALAKRINITYTLSIDYGLDNSYVTIGTSDLNIRYCISRWYQNGYDGKNILLTPTDEVVSHKLGKYYVARCTPMKDTTLTLSLGGNGSVPKCGELFNKIVTTSVFDADTAANWLWISMPYDCGIVLKQANGDTLHRCVKGTNAVGFLLREYDSESRALLGPNHATKENPVFVDVPVDSLEGGRGYILGIDDRASFPVTAEFASDSSLMAVPAYSSCAFGHSTGGHEAYRDWHLIGNGLFHNTRYVDTGATDVIYFGVPDANGRYTTVECFNGDSIPNELTPYGAFFVQRAEPFYMSSTASNLPRVKQLSSGISSGYVDKVTLTLSSDSSSLSTYFRFAEGHSPNYSTGYDLLDLNYTVVGIDQFHSLADNAALQYNWLHPESQTVALGGYVSADQDVEFSIGGDVEKFEAIELYDRTTGTSIDISKTNYKTSVNAGSFDNRFEIAFVVNNLKTGMVQPADSAPCPFAIANDNTLTVYDCHPGEALTIVDMNGRCVHNSKPTSPTHSIFNLSQGVYVLRHCNLTKRIIIL